MSDHSKFFRAGARALTGLLISAVAATGVVLLGVIPFPSAERAPHAITVDTLQTNERDLVCAGSFAELGADPARPDDAVPVGEASVIVAGDGELTQLNTASVLTGSATSAIAAAQTQRPSSATLSGLVASSCVEPSNEQWLVGGGTTLGISTTLNLGNATDVAATVQVSVFDEFGEIADFQTAGVIVAPNSEQIVSLNGYAPNREGLAVRVTSTGAPVAASLGVARVEVLQPVGTASVTRQLRATNQLVFPGITNVYKHEHEHEGEIRPGDAGPADIYPVRVQALTPGDSQGTAFVYAVNANGERTELGSIELLPKTLGTLQVTTWPTDATALVVDADVPIFGAAEGTSGSDSVVDFDWFVPAPVIAVDTEVAVPVVPGGALFLANTSDTDAEVTIEALSSDTAEEDADANGADKKPTDAVKPKTITVPAGSAVQVDGAGSFTISSSAPIHAGVRIVAVGTLAGYPIAPLAERGGELTVYTR